MYFELVQMFPLGLHGLLLCFVFVSENFILQVPEEFRDLVRISALTESDGPPCFHRNLGSRDRCQFTCGASSQQSRDPWDGLEIYQLLPRTRGRSSLLLTGTASAVIHEPVITSLKSSFAT